MRTAALALATLSLAAQEERAFVESLARLERQDPAAAKDLEAASPLRAAALSLDPAKAPEATRFAAASWLWATGLIRGVAQGKEQTYLQAAHSQPDLLKAWGLLDAVGKERARARDGMRLELAWRLLDIGRMRAAYAAVSSEPALTVRERAHAFFVAAHLGDWDGMKQHAQALLAQGGKLEGLHAAAESNPFMFDYESLLKAVEVAHPAPATGPLPVRSYRISAWRMRITGISGNRKDLTQAAEAWPKGWVDRPDARGSLLQVGAAAHWAEGSAQPPASGFFEATRLYLVGYRESAGGTSDAGWQEQVWDLRPDPQRPGRWHGTQTLTARIAGADAAKGPALRVTFEVEWDLHATETFPESLPPASPAIPKPAP